MDLTIIIPTYRPGDYFDEAVTSIALQDLGDFKIEILIILNGERDPFYDRLLSYDFKFPSKVIYTEEKGASGARNIGIDNAKGRFILFLDDDDLLSENFLSKMLNIATYDDALYISNVRCFRDGGCDFYKDYIGKAMEGLKYASSKSSHFAILRYSKLLSSACFKLIPRAVIQQERFNVKLSISEDALFMYSISHRVKEITLLHDSYYYRRVRTNSASNTKKSTRKHIENYIVFITALTSAWLKTPSNFLFFLNRFLASTKHLLLKLV